MTETGKDYPILIGQTGPLDGHRWVISKPATIGRDPSCDIIIPERQISRFHASLMPTGEGIVLEDLGSKNGTYYKGKRLEGSALLRDGDMVQVALVQSFLFLSSEATLPLDSTQLPAVKPRGRLNIDARARRVWLGQNELLPPLSAPQFQLLQLLASQPGVVVSRNAIIDNVWGEDQAAGVSDQALDALIRRLRERLREVDPDIEYITTMRGSGVRFDNAVS
jgi:pSer/pThr/pTyr-binding forkhead associated (FHA) protein